MEKQVVRNLAKAVNALGVLADWNTLEQARATLDLLRSVAKSMDGKTQTVLPSREEFPKPF